MKLYVVCTLHMHTHKPIWLFRTRFDVLEHRILTNPIVLTDQRLNTTANDLILRHTYQIKYMNFGAGGVAGADAGAAVGVAMPIPTTAYKYEMFYE